jgi:CBS-domain-containing membrane protein
MTVTSITPIPVFAGWTVRDAALTTPKTHPASVTIGEIHGFFADDHVHTALVVDADGRLMTMLERGDLNTGPPLTAPAAAFGTLADRTTSPDDLLADAYRRLLRLGRRRLAVTDADGTLLGLLCLKHHLAGFCTSEDVANRSIRSRTASGVSSQASMLPASCHLLDG